MSRVRLVLLSAALTVLIVVETSFAAQAASGAEAPGRPPDWTGGAVQQEPDPRSASIPPAPYKPATDNPIRLRQLQFQAQRNLKRAQAAVGKSSTKALSPTPAISSGLNQQGLTAADESGVVTPSDSTGAIGPNHYVEMINNLIAVYDRNLNRIGSAVSFGSFFNFNNHPGTVTDPQVQWDQQANRWLVAATLQQPGANYLFYGWSRTADPTNLSAAGYCVFEISNGNDFEDYPKLGHDTTGLVIGANLADNPAMGGTGSVLTATIFEFKKPANGVTTCTRPTTNQWGKRATRDHLLNGDGTPARTPVPANTTDAGTNTYIVAAHSPLLPNFTPKVMIWHIRYGQNGAPSLVPDVDLAVPIFNVPLNAPQAASPNYLEASPTGDGRLTQAVARVDPDASNNLAVWTQHTVTEGNTPAVVVWYEIIPATGSLRQSGDTFKDLFTSTFNGAISPTIDGNEAVVAYNQSSSTQLTSIVVQSRLSSTPLGQLDPVATATIGNSANPEADFSCGGSESAPCGWGDYSALTPDPLNHHIVWGTNAVTGTGPSPNTAGWITRNFSVSTLGPAACRTSILAGGYYHSVALGSDGSVWAWGADNYGQVGNGTTVQSQTTPVQVSGPNGVGILTGITGVAAGQYHSVAVRGTDGTAWAWGNNFDGELGDLSGTNQNTPVQVVITQTGGQPLTGISVVASRNSHSLAIRRSDGSVWAWGLNTSGQLGNGTVASFRGAAQVIGIGGVGFLTGIVAISAGDNFSVAVDSSGNVYAWGDDSAGQLGDNRFGAGIMSSTPVRVHGLNNVGTLFGGLAAASRANGSDALNSDHTLSAWGTGNQPQSIYPVVVAGAGGSGTLFPMVAVGAGVNTTLTIDPDTGLWDWGDNTYGQLGDGTTTFHPNAVQVLDIGGGPSLLTGVVAATGGLNHSLAVLSDGRIAAWGSNVSGQLGDGTTTDRTIPVQVIMPTAAQPVAC